MGLIESLDCGDILIIVPFINIDTTWLKNLNEQLPQWHVEKNWDQFKKLKNNRRIFLIHYEGLRPHIKKVQQFKWSLVVFDESQRLKKRSTIQSRLGLKLNNQSRRVALSGTPMDGDPIDLWAQFRFVEPQALGEKWSIFENQYLMRTGYMGYQRVFRPEKHNQFLKIIQPYSLRINKRDVLPGPAPEVIIAPVCLLGSQASLYHTLERDMISSFGNSKITSSLKITLINKLQQITGGFVIDDEGNTISVGNAKLRKLQVLVKKLEKPIVIFCRFRAEIDAIHQKLSLSFSRVETIHGGIKNQLRSHIQNDFQGGLVDILICQLKTGGVGIDLFRSHNAVFYSMSHSYIDFDQAISRLDRRGQKNKVNIFLIKAVNTIDEDLSKAITSKSSISGMILNRLKRKIL